jgi:hypothetical protein
MHSTKHFLIESRPRIRQSRTGGVHTQSRNTSKQEWQGTPQGLHVWSPDEKRILK